MFQLYMSWNYFSFTLTLCHVSKVQYDEKQNISFSVPQSLLQISGDGVGGMWNIIVDQSRLRDGAVLILFTNTNMKRSKSILYQEEKELWKK